MTPQAYTLTRTRHQVPEGVAPQEPELLETYIDGVDGEPWTGGYLRHEIGDRQLVSAHVATVVMTDPGLRLHYTCEPPVPISAPATTTERHDSPLVPADPPADAPVD